MKSIYDDPTFYAAYGEMPRSKMGLAAAGEWHQLQPLFPPMAGKRVLDLGCGYGWHSKYAAQQGAEAVLGLDLSEKMIETAQARNGDPRIMYQVCGIEDYAYPPDTYDLVISNLALHYIADLDTIFTKVYGTLREGGTFLLNIEHPVFTAGIAEDWIYDDQGHPLAWPVDRYFYPGARETRFLGQTVRKQHHTLTQILMGLLQAGFRLEVVEEAQPGADMMELPGMADEMRRPMMLLVRAKK